MVLENVCAPALLYLAFSIIQIIIDMYRGDTIQAFFKFIVMIIFTIVLNAICSSGMTIMSWFIVFIPFILMTYITTILFFVFGIDPSKITQPAKKCGETQFGCCPDGVTPKEDMIGRGCPRTRLVNVINVKEPTPANNKDKHYLYPQGRSTHDYSLGGRSVSTNKKYLGDVNRDKNFYDYKKIGSYRDRLRSNITPKAIDSKSSYWKSKLGKSYWDDDKTAQDKITAASKPATPDLQDKTIINYLLSTLAQMQAKLTPLAATTTPAAPVAAPGAGAAAGAGAGAGAAPGAGPVAAPVAGAGPVAAPVAGPVAGAAPVAAPVAEPVAGPPVSTVPPVISAPATTVNSPIITTNGTWTGSPTITFSYQWQRGDTPITGEVSSTYIIKQIDVSQSIKCKVTATNALGSSSATSNGISIT